MKPRILELSIPALHMAIDVHVRAIFCRGIAVGWPLVVGRGMVVAPATATKLGLQFQFLFSGSSRHSLCGPCVVHGLSGVLFVVCRAQQGLSKCINFIRSCCHNDAMPPA